MLPQPGLHAPGFHNSVLGSHLGNNTSSLNNGPGLLGTSGNMPTSNLLPSGNVNNPGMLPTGNSMNPQSGAPQGLLPRPFPISIPNSNLQSETSPHSNHSSSPVTSQGYINFNSNHLMPGNKLRRSNTPNSENSTGSLSPLNTTGSDCEMNGSCRCGIINCVAGNEHVHGGQNLPPIYITNPPSPDVKVEGLTGVYTPTATTVAPSTLLIPAKNNYSKNKDVTILNDTPAPKLFKPYKSDIAERA